MHKKSLGVGLAGPDIFISYCREERPAARRFADCFESEGLKVWWDAVLRSGETFDEVIEQELRAAKAVVVLWSPRSVASRWVRAEATMADRANKLVPVIIERCNLPIIFELTHTADLAEWAGDRADPRWRALIEDLRRLVGPAQAPAAVAKAAPEPAGPAPAALLAQKTSSELERDEFFRWSDQFRENETPRHTLRPVDGGGSAQCIGVKGLTLGRSAECDLTVPGIGVSRVHCKVELVAGQVRVTDLNSTNGTFIDDKRVIGSAILKLGSVLRVGNTAFSHEVEAPIAGAGRGALEPGAGAAARLARPN